GGGGAPGNGGAAPPDGATAGPRLPGPGVELAGAGAGPPGDAVAGPDPGAGPRRSVHRRRGRGLPEVDPGEPGGLARSALPPARPPEAPGAGPPDDLSPRRRSPDPR